MSAHRGVCEGTGFGPKEEGNSAYTRARMDPEDSMLGEISRSPKSKSCLAPLTQGLRRTETHREGEQGGGRAGGGGGPRGGVIWWGRRFCLGR